MTEFTVVNCTPGMENLEKDFAEKLTIDDKKKKKSSSVSNSSKASGKAKAKPTSGKKKVVKKATKKPAKKVITKEEITALVEERAFKTQEKLCLNDVTPEELKEAGKLMLPEHYDEVVEDRVVSGKCGYPCCPNSVKGKKPLGKYYFSLTKVYDMSHVNDFCSKECNLASRLFRRSLEDIPLLMRSGYKDIADIVDNGETESEKDRAAKKKEDIIATFGSESVIEHEIDDSGIAIGGVDEDKIRESMKSGGNDATKYTPLNPNAVEGYEVPAFRNANISVPGTSCNLEFKGNYNMYGFEYDDDDDYFEVEEDEEEDDDEGFVDDYEDEGMMGEEEEEFNEERALSERYKFMRLSEEGWVTFYLREWKTDFTGMEIRKLEMPLEAEKIGPTMVSQGDDDGVSRKEAFGYMIDTRFKMLMDKYDFPFIAVRNGAYGILNTFMFRDQVPAFSEKQIVMFCLVLAEIVRSRVLDRDDPVMSAAVLVSSRKIMSAYKIPNDKIDDIIRSFL